MTTQTLFQLSNLLVIPFWLLMIALPRRPWVVRLIRSPWIAVPPALIYVAVIVPTLLQMGPGLFSAFGSLAGVMGLLATPQGALAGWAHFLAFDLFTGRWAYLDAIERKIPALLMVPALFFIFVLGPIGLLLYLLLRLVFGTRASNQPAS